MLFSVTAVFNPLQFIAMFSFTFLLDLPNNHRSNKYQRWLSGNSVHSSTAMFKAKRKSVKEKWLELKMTPVQNRHEDVCWHLVKTLLWGHELYTAFSDTSHHKHTQHTLAMKKCVSAVWIPFYTEHCVLQTIVHGGKDDGTLCTYFFLCFLFCFQQ